MPIFKKVYKIFTVLDTQCREEIRVLKENRFFRTFHKAFGNKRHREMSMFDDQKNDANRL